MNETNVHCVQQIEIFAVVVVDVAVIFDADAVVAVVVAAEVE